MRLEWDDACIYVGNRKERNQGQTSDAADRTNISTALSVP